MVGWHHQLDRHEFEQALGVFDGQGWPCVLQSMGLQRDTIERLNLGTDIFRGKRHVQQ